MKIYQLIIILFLGILIIPFQSSANKDIKLIRQRIVTELMKQDVDDSYVDNLLGSFQKDSTWVGINYDDVSRTGFEHSRHAGNLVYLGRAYKKQNSEFFESEKVKQIIEMALAFWVRKDFICDNWWHNQIGIPTSFVSLMLIVGDDLSDDLIESIQPIIGRANLNASGARPSGDRIKIAAILAKNLLFIEDFEQFKHVIRIIEGEIKFATERGMQYDYSFHHRVDRVNNTLSYGLSYAGAFVEWAYYVEGTSFSFSDDKLNHLIDYYLDGICKHLVYGKYTDPGAKNRSISRKGSFKSHGIGIPEKLIRTTSYRKDELEKIIDIRKGNSLPGLSHCTFYWHSEHFVFQRPDFFTSVRMYSTRNANMEEPYNSEGLLNHHRGDGTNHILLKGDEYHGIWPVYDWQKIPGATIMQKSEFPLEQEIQKHGLAEFAGAVTDGKYGAAAFDFISPHDPLKARKAWFFFDNEYVCLGAGITSSTNLPVVTTINQCLLNGSVFIMKDRKLEVLNNEEHKLENVDWVLHNDVAYVFPKNTSINLKNNTANGSWFRISKQNRTSKNKVKMDVFNLWIDHGEQVEDATYQYIVKPAVSLKQLIASKGKNQIKVLSNTSELQAVVNSKLEMYQLVFYRSGELNFSEKNKIICNSSGMFMVKMNGEKIKEITVSDPSRKLAEINFSISSNIQVEKDNIQCSWNDSIHMSDISISLPLGVYAGKSVTINLLEL